jgi:hypothetical protein
MLGALILIGLLIVLFVGAYYLGSTQKMPNQRKRSALDDFYRSRGMGNVADGLNQVENVVRPTRQNSSSSKHRKKSQRK